MSKWISIRPADLLHLPCGIHELTFLQQVLAELLAQKALTAGDHHLHGAKENEIPRNSEKNS